jgi:acyl carrier protein
VTGGLGGIGLEVARWLVARGARYLVLLGRRVAHTAAIRELESRGARVHYAVADVGDGEQLRAALRNVDAQQWPPLRGVVHAAGIGHAEKLVDLDLAAMRDVLRPKVIGTWELHQALAGRPLDFFVMFSSATHQLGLLGQGVAAYSAANAFLDGMAHLRRARSQPALSLCWGPWTQVGMAAQTGNDERLRGFGIAGIPPEEGLRALGHFLGKDRAQVWVLPVDWAKLFEADTDLARSPWLSEVAAAAGLAGESEDARARRLAFLESLRSAPAKARHKLLVEHIQAHVVDVMRLESRDAVDWRRGLFEIGMDSLMALELKNRLQASLGLSIPATLAFNYPTVDAIGGYLAEQLCPASVEGEREEAELDKHLEVTASQIRDLDESAMESLLERKLETL